MKQQQLTFDHFYQEFFDTYLKRRPVSASFIGKHEYDGLLPDYSPCAVDDTRAEMRAQLSRSRAMSADALSPRAQLDKTLLEGFLETQLWEYSSAHFQFGNPCQYTGEALFGLLSCLLSAYAPAPLRFDAMEARMAQFPAFFAQAKQNIPDAPTQWTKRAISECDAGLLFLNCGLQRALTAAGLPEKSLCHAAETAAASLRDYKAYLETELLDHVRDNVCAGEEAFSLMLTKAHFLSDNPKDMAAAAEDEIARCTSYLKQHAADFGATCEEDTLATLCDIHPSAEGYLARYGEIWNDVEALAQKQNLVTWPDFPIEYVNQYEWAKECAPNLYFLFYRSPAAFNRPVVHEYLAPPLRAGELSGDALEAFLRANNDSVIRGNHVVHHGSIGHHVQNYNAFHQTNSLIGQFAGCDCACRPAMLSSGTMIEGWAVYVTKLMAEYGLLSPLEEYAEYAARRRMLARTVVDIKLHTGCLTLEQAARYYLDHARMSAGSAMGEAVKNSMFPGGAVIYVAGSDMIASLRESVRRKLGAAFSMRDFHDAVLSYGSVPVALVKKQLSVQYGLTD